MQTNAHTHTLSLSLKKKMLRVTWYEVAFVFTTPTVENDVAARERRCRNATDAIEIARNSRRCDSGTCQRMTGMPAECRRRGVVSCRVLVLWIAAARHDVVVVFVVVWHSSRMTTRPDECVQVFRGWNRNGPGFSLAFVCGYIIRAFRSARRCRRERVSALSFWQMSRKWRDNPDNK